MNRARSHRLVDGCMLRPGWKRLEQVEGSRCRLPQPPEAIRRLQVAWFRWCCSGRRPVRTPLRRTTRARPSGCPVRVDHHLRLRAVAVPLGRPGPVRPGGQTAGGAAAAAAFPGRQPGPRRVRWRPVRPGLRRRPAGGGARSRNLARIAFGRASVRWSQLGFGRTSSTSTSQSTPRNLMGFKDGTMNLKAEEPERLDEHVWVPPGADPKGEWLAGGTYLVVRRINMTIETWDRQSLREQEQIIGRTKAEGAPLSGGTEFSQPDFALQGPGRRAADGGRRPRADGAPGAEPRRTDAAPGLQLRRRQQRARPDGRRAVLPGLRGRPANPLHPDADQARPETTD